MIIEYEPDETIINGIHILEGRLIDIMPKLASQGNIGLSAAGIMDLRNYCFESGKEDLIKQLCYHSLDAADGIISHPDYNRVKIVWDSPNLRSLTQKSELGEFSGWSALNLEKEGGAKRFDYFPSKVDDIQLVFNKEDLKKFISQSITDKNSTKYKFWLALARGNKNRLETYVKNIQSKINHEYIMEVYGSDIGPSFEAERCLQICGLGASGQVDIHHGRLEVKSCRIIRAHDVITPVRTKTNLEDSIKH